MIIHCNNDVSTFLKEQPDTQVIIHKIHQEAKRIIRTDINLYLSLQEKIGLTYLKVAFGIREEQELELVFLQKIQEIFQNVNLSEYSGWFSVEIIDEKTMLRKVVENYGE